MQEKPSAIGSTKTQNQDLKRAATSEKKKKKFMPKLNNGEKSP